MADEKFNIEVAVNAQLESLNKIQDALGELNKKLGIVSDSISSKKCLCMCHDEYWRENVRPCTKVSEFCDRGNTSFRATRSGGTKAGGGDKVARGGDVSEVLPIMSPIASEMQRITIYGDEQVLSMQSMATAMGVSADQKNLCIQGAIGLTNVYGIGLNEAVRAAASAYPL